MTTIFPRITTRRSKDGLYPIGYVIPMKDIPSIWDVPFNSERPFPHNARLAVKGIGRNSSPIEITTKNDADEHNVFTYAHNDTELSGRTPHKILYQMGIRGIIKPTNGNWSSIFATLDNGQTYVLLKDLRFRNATQNGRTLDKNVRNWLKKSVKAQ